MSFEEAIGQVARAIEAAGVAVVVIGIAVATVRFVARARHPGPIAPLYRRYRQALARAILLGLEFLVAGDIIRNAGRATSTRPPHRPEWNGTDRHRGDQPSRDPCRPCHRYASCEAGVS